jgi:hypothetical protein
LAMPCGRMFALIATTTITAPATHTGPKSAARYRGKD